MKQAITTIVPPIRREDQGVINDALIELSADASEADGWWHCLPKLVAELPADAMTQLRETVLAELRSGSGAIIIRLGAAQSPASVRLLQLAIGQSLGPNLTIAPDARDRPLFKVSAVEGKGETGEYKGNAKKTTAIGFHTDGSGVHTPVAVLSMGCIRRAEEGGESRVVDARVVHALTSDAALQVLESPQPRENPYRATTDPKELVSAPVFDRDHGNAFSYHPARVRNGIRQLRGELSAEENAALDELDARLDACAVDYMLEPGDIVMMDNRRLAHDRRPFRDDPAAPRLIERLWIGDPPVR